MTLLPHIRRCNAHDPAALRPLVVDGVAIGQLTPKAVALLRLHPTVFVESDQGFTLAAGLDAPAARAAAIDAALQPHAGNDGIGPWRGEKFPAAPAYGQSALFAVERCLVPVLGLKGYGVHVNGYIPAPDGDPQQIRMWIARRAATDRTFPGELDHMVAGGMHAGLTPFSCTVKEAEEEAGVPEALASTARPVGMVRYRLAMDGWLRDDGIFCYDLPVPADFLPHNQDGEVERFMLWPVAQVIRELRAGFAFKFNVPLVIIDFLIRHGLIDPEDPEYEALCAGLKGPG